MTRATYDVKEQYTGDGSLAAYTFDFKIESLSQLLVIEMDDTNVETQRVRGDNTTYLDSVDFDPIDGAGTVNLKVNLPTDYKLFILLANDEPTQPYEFRNKGTFTLKRIESALDFLAGALQRLAYRGKQALRIHDSEDQETFDAQFPPGVTDAAERYLKVNDAGDGFEFGFTIDELADVIFPENPLSGQLIQYNGANWVNTYFGGGGLNIAATQSIPGNGQITLGALAQQMLKVQGVSGSQTTSTTPFVTPPTNGTIIVLKGESDTSVLKIPYADIDEGCILKGDCYLSQNDTLTLMYDLSAKRYIELSRN